MASVKDSFLDLERHIQLLEENAEKLRGALQHWQLWEAEYEALKEEVESLPAPAGRRDLARIRRDFDGQVVTRKEVAEILGAADFREPEQIVGVVARRIDYVSRNVRTLEGQLRAAENKLAAAAVVSNPDVRHEDGEMVTDIIEQLDEEDKVTSYRLQKAGDVQPQILEALGKAGIRDLPDIHKKPEPAAAANGEPSPKREEEPAEAGRPSPRKSVSFTEDTKPGREAPAPEAPMSMTAKRLEAVMRQAQEQEKPAEDPVIPEDESDDDAELRREMLRYGMSDIAPIVAELEIESDQSEDEGYDDEEDDPEDEDEHGRYKYSVIDDEYRQRMLELGEKLGFTPSRPGPEPESPVPVEGVGRITVVKPTAQSEASPASALKQDKPKQSSAESKGVRFAEDLDIAPEEVEIIQPSEKKPEETVNPVSDIVVEGSRKAQRQADAQPKKVSRFKKDRSGGNAEIKMPMTPLGIGAGVPRGPTDAPSRFLDTDDDVKIAPSGPEGKTIADRVLERDAPSEPKAPDEFDAALLHQEAAAEYHRVRNRFIQKEGGFAKQDESPIQPLDEEEGGPKRMSRFKAARLSKQ